MTSRLRIQPPISRAEAIARAFRLLETVTPPGFDEDDFVALYELTKARPAHGLAAFAKIAEIERMEREAAIELGLLLNYVERIPRKHSGAQRIQFGDGYEEIVMHRPATKWWAAPFYRSQDEILGEGSGIRSRSRGDDGEVGVDVVQDSHQAM